MESQPGDPQPHPFGPLVPTPFRSSLHSLQDHGWDFLGLSPLGETPRAVAGPRPRVELMAWRRRGIAQAQAGIAPRERQGRPGLS